jgi:hypothetical protein
MEGAGGAGPDMTELDRAMGRMAWRPALERPARRLPQTARPTTPFQTRRVRRRRFQNRRVHYCAPQLHNSGAAL